MSKKQAINELLNRKDTRPVIQEDVNTVILGTSDDVPKAKKKATYELDADLHTELKVYAAKNGKKMVDVVEAALREYFEKQ